MILKIIAVLFRRAADALDPPRPARSATMPPPPVLSPAPTRPELSEVDRMVGTMQLRNALRRLAQPFLHTEETFPEA